jgi:hypothetical protein
LGGIIDIFIDVGSHGLFVNIDKRKEFIKNFKAYYGTANGFWVYPPQRWDRLRWFIPHFKENINNLKKVFRDGGRSCELYLSPIINPGAEITLLCNGMFINNTTLSVGTILHEAVVRLYGPKNREEEELICDIFSEAEDVFMASYNPLRNRTLDEAYSDGVEDIFIWSDTNKDIAVPGEFFLEPLFGIGPGYPCYLTLHFDRNGRRKYYEGIQKILEKAKSLKLLRPECERTRRIVHSLNLVLKDIAGVIREIDI